MKSKSQLIREFLNGLGKRVEKILTKGDLFCAQTQVSIIQGHINGTNIYVDVEWEK